ncbi:MAG: DUF4097 family beta strand repeat-containing protein [Melioribacteraceae bacterium]|nr:DUF4097 family beta strand repeat-containing protein [Melioribacteraceae bacterium]
MTNIKFYFLTFLLSIFLLSTLSASIEKTEKKSFNVKYGGDLLLDTDIGSIKINTHSSETIDVKIYLKAKTNDEEKAEKIFNAFEIVYDQSGPDLSITAEFKGSSSWFSDLFGGSKWNKLNVRFLVTVPEKYNVDLKTSGGGITVDDLNGLVDAKTSGGGLTFGNISGDINGKTSGGGIVVGECSGDVNVKTSGGGIKIDKCEGSVKASTSGGGITVNEVYGPINASTSGGSVYASIHEQFSEDCSLTTSGGGVTVKIKENINAFLDAKTSGGSVSSEIPVNFTGKTRSSSLKGDINSGGPKLYLRSSGGSIKVEAL